MTELNRLANEKSPYLLQHAGNPVDWYPWGEEAFEKAAREDKPILLSIGYSTCHWCHVMEHESFEDPEVARLLNEAFVSIKVDREERPDIDAIYMTVCQILSKGGCGWPLNIVMTPDRKPFFAATYIPKEARFGRAGMVDLVPK
ncbi:MAG: thioredoxin domain-containing protein, partial [Candidatus Dadabacteria bacterium]